MVKYSDSTLDTVFAALGDKTRRGILAALSSGARSITELSAPYEMSLPGFVKHLQILEGAGLIAREKNGRVVQCSLTAQGLQPAEEWLAHYRQFWESRLDALEKYLNQQEPPWPLPQNNPRSESSASSKRLPRRSGGRGRPPKR